MHVEARVTLIRTGVQIPPPPPAFAWSETAYAKATACHGGKRRLSRRKVAEYNEVTEGGPTNPRRDYGLACQQIQHTSIYSYLSTLTPGTTSAAPLISKPASKNTTKADVRTQPNSNHGVSKLSSLLPIRLKHAHSSII